MFCALATAWLVVLWEKSNRLDCIYWLKTSNYLLITAIAAVHRAQAMSILVWAALRKLFAIMYNCRKLIDSIEAKTEGFSVNITFNPHHDAL